MPHKSFTTEQIINKPGEPEVLIGQRQTVPAASKAIGVTEKTYFRWRRAYGGLKIDQAQRVRELEHENNRL